MVNPFHQLPVRNAFIQSDSVPVLLVEMICRGNFRIPFAKFDGQLRIAFQADEEGISSTREFLHTQADFIPFWISIYRVIVVSCEIGVLHYGLVILYLYYLFIGG